MQITDKNLILDGWELIETGDASPSLTWRLTGEAMHHSAGALAETEYVYGTALDLGFELHPEPQIVSVGLGLGYIEFLAAKKAWLRSQAFTLVSFESRIELREMMIDFILGKENPLLMRVLILVAGDPKLIEPIRSLLKKLYLEQSFKIEEGLDSAAQISTQTQILCWDAFSRQTSESLWSQDLLNEVFRKLKSQTVVASYASNSALKKTLKNHHFENKKRPGFSNKRESTLALKK